MKNTKLKYFIIFCSIITTILVAKLSIISLAKDLEITVVKEDYNIGTTIKISSSKEIKQLKMYKKASNDKFILFYVGTPKKNELEFTIKNSLLSENKETEIKIVVIDNDGNVLNESMTLKKIKPRVSMNPEETAKPTTTPIAIPTKPTSNPTSTANPSSTSQNESNENNDNNKNSDSNEENENTNSNDNSDSEDNSSSETPTGLSISLSDENIEIEEGKIYELTATVYPEDAEIEWYTTNAKIVKIIKIENNVATLKGVKKGKANVFISLKHKLANCDVTVIEPEDELADAETAIGINGGFRIQFKRVEGAKSYKLIAKDYNGKTHEVNVPNNVSGAKSHDYEVFKTNIGDMIFWNVQKLDQHFYKINTWMNKNSELYEFKVEAYNGNELLSETKWMKGMTYNIEKDAPEQNSILPDIFSASDPEKGRQGTVLTKADNKTNLIDNKRVKFTKIQEGDKAIQFEWENTIPNFNPTKYIIQYKEYYSNDESKNISIPFNITNIYADENITSYVLDNLENEQEYLIQVIAVGEGEGDNKIYIMAEEVAVPHTEATRKALLPEVNKNRCDPYNDRHNLTGYFTRSQAEAFANYGKNGKAFQSETEYFLWVNMHQVRMYIFRKSISNEWRLWKDMPVGICQHYTRSPYRPAGEFNVLGREWDSDAGVKWGVNYENASFGNIFHSVGKGSEHVRMIERERFCTAGCTSVDLPWIKWLYDYGIRSYVFNDYGRNYK